MKKRIDVSEYVLRLVLFYSELIEKKRNIKKDFDGWNVHGTDHSINNQCSLSIFQYLTEVS